eukprot:6189396-Pleurochrysis_carterae.AAC.1
MAAVDVLGTLMVLRVVGKVDRGLRIRADLAVHFALSGLALFSRPAFALSRGGDWVVVSRLTVLGLNGVGVVAIHLPERDWIHMTR